MINHYIIVRLTHGFIKFNINNSQTDVTKYTEYVFSFKRDWFLTISSAQIKEEYDELSDNLSGSDDFFQDSFSGPYNKSVNSNGKRIANSFEYK